MYLSPRREVAIVGDEIEPLAATVRDALRPNLVLAGAGSGDLEAQRAIPLLDGREPVDGKTAAYVCASFACRLPVTSPAELKAELDQA